MHCACVRGRPGTCLGTDLHSRARLAHGFPLPGTGQDQPFRGRAVAPCLPPKRRSWPLKRAADSPFCPALPFHLLRARPTSSRSASASTRSRASWPAFRASCTTSTWMPTSERRIWMELRWIHDAASAVAAAAPLGRPATNAGSPVRHARCQPGGPLVCQPGVPMVCQPPADPCCVLACSCSPASAGPPTRATAVRRAGDWALAAAVVSSCVAFLASWQQRGGDPCARRERACM